jgi:hypothetical protein
MLSSSSRPKGNQPRFLRLLGGPVNPRVMPEEGHDTDGSLTSPLPRRLGGDGEGMHPSGKFL